MKNHIQAGIFKAQCLHLLDVVKNTHKGLIITKHGKPVAQLIPLEEKKERLFGKLAGSVKIVGDIIQPIDEEWNVTN